MTSKPETVARKILVVDDHPVSRTHALRSLLEFNRTVQAADSAAEGITRTLDWYPNVIFMDRHMPDMDGLEAIRRIRMEWPDEKPPPRIILITADPSGIDPQILSGLGVDDLLVKPATGRQLKDALVGAATHTVKEDGWGNHGTELRGVFARELQERLPQLDECVTDSDRKPALDILHQLIASAAICSERQLENELRRLDQSLRGHAEPKDLAGSYYNVLASARAFLQRYPDASG